MILVLAIHEGHIQLFQFMSLSEGNHSALHYFHIAFIFSDTMLYLMKYEDYNELIFKNDDTRQLNAEMACSMCNLSNYFAALCEVRLSNAFFKQHNNFILKFYLLQKLSRSQASLDVPCYTTLTTQGIIR